MIRNNKIEKRWRLKRHIRLRVSGTLERPRLTVYRSLRHVYVQIVDDTSGKTLVAASDRSKGYADQFEGVKSKIALGKKVGALTAKLAHEKNIDKVVFDRNGYLYHGVVKAVADGAREGGLKF